MEAIDARFVITNAKPGTGMGLFATQDIRAGDFILEYTGEKISTVHADSLKTQYLFEINDQWTIDGSPLSNTARYINHSCDPNTEAEIEDDRIMIYAIKNVVSGEEITIDYDLEYFDEFIRPFGCKCGAAKHH